MLIDFKTPNKQEYQIFPFRHGIFQFNVKAANDVNLTLSNYQTRDFKPCVEVIIGRWGNTNTAIVYNHNEPVMVDVPTENILSPTELRGFWIRYDNGIVSVGRVGDRVSDAILSWNAKLHDPDLNSFRYVGVCTAYGATGEWTVDLPQIDGLLSWIPSTNGSIMPSAIEGGEDINGEKMFVARARYQGDLVSSRFFSFLIILEKHY